ncbi:MAG TPA: thioredoxin family protein [Rhodocyclaceae bacterium]|nr:thioredoxin family protein [Rhodocyclaceae bacterium]
MSKPIFKFFRFALLLCAFVAGSAIAAAQFGKPFDQATFDALQRGGKPTLVMIHADWCPTCKAQDPLLFDLLKQPQNAVITPLRVDFDKQKNIVRAFKVTMQSTLIVFKGGKEVGRSTGDTSRAGIAALLKKAV